MAKTLIKMMGHSGTIPSSLALDDIPAALAALRSDVAKRGAQSNSPANAGDEEESGESGVSIGHRALPLIEMLESALEQGDYVIWDR